MSSFNPLVSVVIPVYNGADFLKEAIESALNQTYSNIEILVINDGSNDANKTEKTAQSFKSKIRYFKKENGGVSSALNMGIEKMKGAYFSWLSHDDLYHVDKIQKQIEYISDNPKLNVIGCNFKMENLNTSIIKIFKTKLKIIDNGRDALTIWINFCSLLIKKSALKEASFFNENNKTCQDLEMILRLVERNPIHILEQILVTRREHESQGVIANITAHLIEKNSFYKSLIKTFKIDFFANNKKISSKYSILCFLGDHCMKIGLTKTGKYYFTKAFCLKPFSPKVLLFILFGNFFWKRTYSNE